MKPFCQGLFSAERDADEDMLKEYRSGELVDGVDASLVNTQFLHRISQYDYAAEYDDLPREVELPVDLGVLDMHVWQVHVYLLCNSHPWNSAIVSSGGRFATTLSASLASSGKNRLNRSAFCVLSAWPIY